MRAAVALLVVSGANGLSSLSCSDLNVAFVDSGCQNSCSSTTCLYTLPECASASAGHVCHDGTNVVVKGLAEAFDLSGANSIGLKKSIIPENNAAFDLGSAEYKIRHLYLSDT